MVDTSPGWLNLGKHTVREDKRKNHGVIDVAQILQKSSNVGVTKLTLALPPERLWETYRSVGFGSTTGCGFPGESAGNLPHPPQEASFVLATMSFGYGLSVTPLQLAQAYAILGSGGIKRPCTFIKADEVPEGERVLKSSVARQVVDMLTSVVEQGSGSKAKVVGYHIAGKTGTARKIAATGGYEENSHVAVFAGLAPASNPRFAIVVVIDDPKGLQYYGSQIAAPLFSRIASSALRIYNIAPDREDLQLRIATSLMDTEDHIQHD
jgi:cell division protein FtsI (penicillin-binding protein 3)